MAQFTHTAGSHPTVCDECNAKEQQRLREEHFNDLRTLTLEERVERIERILYDQPRHTSYIDPLLRY